jgi:hypothetical protein
MEPVHHLGWENQWENVWSKNLWVLVGILFGDVMEGQKGSLE